MAKKKAKEPQTPAMCSFSVTETGPQSSIYTTTADSSPNVPDEDTFNLHMGRAIGASSIDYAMWVKIMDFAKNVNYERTYNIKGTH